MSSRTSLLFIAPLLASLTACVTESEADESPTASDETELVTKPCPARPPCDAPLPSFVNGSFRHTSSKLTTKLGAPRHRGRDTFATPSSQQWAIAKFAYGVNDKDLEDEDVDVYLLRGCGSTWQRVATARTSDDGSLYASAGGVRDEGGRVFVDLSKIAPLGVGRHRVLFVVRGDHTYASSYIDVLPEGAKIAVTDVDGTLTSGETAEWKDIAFNHPPAANVGSPDVMRTLAARGYHLFYLTARPEWLTETTRCWLGQHGYPAGIVRTTTSFGGANGDAARDFKSAELALLRSTTTVIPSYAFGNKASDVAAFGAAKIVPSHSYYYQLTGDLAGGVRNNDYRTILPTFTALPKVGPATP